MPFGSNNGMFEISESTFSKIAFSLPENLESPGEDGAGEISLNVKSANAQKEINSDCERGAFYRTLSRVAQSPLGNKGHKTRPRNVIGP